MNTFCTRFFKEIYTSNDGFWAPCCYSKISNLNIFNTSIEDWYNSDILTKLRKGDETLFKEYCSHCLKMEKNNEFSPRSKLIKGKQKQDMQKSKIMLKLKFFEDRCNLACFMCKERNSALRKKDLKKLPQFKHYFKSDIKELKLKEIDYVTSTKNMINKIYTIKLTGGEPSIIPLVFNYLDKIKHIVSNIDLQIQTNMMEIEKLEKYFPYFKKVYLKASIDGIGEKNEYLRKRSNWNKIITNIKKYHKKDNIIVDIEPCFTLFNVNDIDKIVNYFKYMDITVNLDNFLHDPYFISYKNLPLELNKTEYKGIETEISKQHFITAVEYMLKLDKIYDDNFQEIFPEYYKYYKYYKRSK